MDEKTMTGLHLMKASGASKSDVDELDNDERWIAEEKLDGARYYLVLGRDRNRLWSRRDSIVDGKRIERTDNVPHLRDLAALKFSDTVLDGEIVAPGNSKSSEVTRVMCALPEKAVKTQEVLGKVAFKVFDLLYFKGEDYRDRLLSVRRETLIGILEVLDSEHLLLPRYVIEGKKAFCQKIWDEGGEGVILKDLNGLYSGTRGKAWLKVKRENTWSVVFTGVKDGNGKYKGQVGAMKFSLYIKDELVEIGQCSGMDDAIRLDVSKNLKKYLGKVFEVKGQEFTGKRIRHPRFLQWRPEMSAKDCQLKEELASC